MLTTRFTRVGLVALVAAATAATGGSGAWAAKPSAKPSHGGGSNTGGSASFASGQLQSQVVGSAGCGTNYAGEASIHVSKANLVGLASEDGLGGGSEFWRGGSAADGCGLEYRGQPNAVGGFGASGGDVDTAIAPLAGTGGKYRLYVASLNLASINVATSIDDGATFTQTPVQGGIPVDDREWIAAYGADTSLLTYHDAATNNIDVLRSDNGGLLYNQIGTAIAPGDYRASSNQLGNIVIDHNSGTAGAFDAYQSFVAPSKDPGPTGIVLANGYDEAFLAVSNDGGHSWTDKAIPCSTGWGGGLDHQFPNVSVSPSGQLWYTASNDKSIFVATSPDKGSTWTCSGPVSSGAQAIEPWIVAGATGEDLVYYATPDAPQTKANNTPQTWYVYFAQNLSTTDPFGFSSTQVLPVHRGAVCEGGVGCTGGRQLYDDFGVDTDQQGYAHIAYSHDAPDLGGSGTYTGYAKQLGGAAVGPPN